jgi:DNA modification methylase
MVTEFLGPYELGKVHCVDCLEALPLLPDGCVDLVGITDPPYGVGLKGKATKWHGPNGVGYNQHTDDAEYIRSMVIPAVKLALQKVTRMVIASGVRHCFEYPKPAEIGGVFCPAGAGMSKWGFTCFHPVLYYGKDPQKGCYPNSFSSNALAENNGHPCPKPLDWMAWLVRRASLENEIVLDFFAGSGTTGVAAVQLGRRFLGFEIDPHYTEIANKRIEAAKRGITVKELEQGQGVLF